MMDDYLQFLLVSPLWYYKFYECLEKECCKLDNDFKAAYASSLNFKRSYLTLTPIRAGLHNGVRIDRHICAEVLPSIIDKAVTIKCTYKSFRTSELNKDPPKLKKYAAEYRIDALSGKASRTIWAYKEDCKVCLKRSIFQVRIE